MGNECADGQRPNKISMVWNGMVKMTFGTDQMTGAQAVIESALNYRANVHQRKE